jgi:ABC-type transport system substrate-binding protein
VPPHPIAANCPASALVLSAILFAAGCGSPRQADDRTLYSHASPVLTFDPAQATDVPSVAAIMRVYEAPLEYAYEEGPCRLMPCLAASMPAFTSNGLVCTFAVRQDARFHDDPCFPSGRGRRILPDDVVFSLKRIADAKLASAGFAFLRDRIVGLDEFRRLSENKNPTDYTLPTPGLRVEDDRVRIELSRPYPQLLWFLAMSYAAVVPIEAVRTYGDALVRHPVGSGPYRLTEWRRNYRLVFRAEPTWTTPHPRNPDMPMALVMRMIADPSTRWLCFLNSELDLCQEIPRDSWDAVMRPDGRLQPDLEARGIQAASIASLTTAYIGINMDDPVLGTNRKLRQALNAAIDAESWTRFYNGRVTPAAGPLPPGIAGGPTGATSRAYDPEAAARLLAEAGYPGGTDPKTGRRLKLRLDLGRADAETRESTELLVRFMDRIGIVIEPDYNTQSAFFRKIEKRQSQMFRIGWVADYPDAENFLQLFYSLNASPGPNRSNYVNPEFDREFEAVRATADSPERTARYARLAARVAEDAPWIFLHHPLDYTVRHPRLAGYRLHQFPYGMEKHYRLTAPVGRKAGPRP